ncbi:hypothetical protein LIER_35245 [Lithospermum erythrorhizon]|uniref:Uncharacterized protein n=1 Tax=Lithospermum erythrorhizon TaxID=34254 RepID=A0AAV3NMD4_LITER
MAAFQRQVDARSAKVAGQARRGTNTQLVGLAHFSRDIRGVVMPVKLKLPPFRKFTRKTDPEDHIAEFQSQMSFHQPDNMVYCRAFSSSLAGHDIKMVIRLLEGCIASFKELKNGFTKTYLGRVGHDKDEQSLMTFK